MKKQAFITGVALFVAVVIAVSSFPGGMTGAVSAVKPEGLGTPTVTTSGNIPSAKDAVIEIKPSFWERLFTDLFSDLNATDDVTPVEETGACCGDSRADELQAQIEDLQAQLDEVKDVQARPCVTVDGITSGTCNAACQNIGMKCYVSLYRRTVDDGTFTTEFRPLWVKAEGDCFGDYYMKFPEVYDERDCTCC